MSLTRDSSYKTSCHKRAPEKSPPKSRSLSASKSPLALTQRVADKRSEQFITLLLVVASHSQTNSGRGNGRLRRQQHVIKYSLPYLLLLFSLLLFCNISWIGKFLKSLLFSCSFDSILFYFSVHSSYLSSLFDNHTFPNRN